jgi:hypothetical protein
MPIHNSVDDEDVVVVVDDESSSRLLAWLDVHVVQGADAVLLRYSEYRNACFWYNDCLRSNAVTFGPTQSWSSCNRMNAHANFDDNDTNIIAVVVFVRGRGSVLRRFRPAQISMRKKKRSVPTILSLECNKKTSGGCKSPCSEDP